MERIGVRELRQNASVYLRRVGAGERFEITDRGEPVAELGPRSESAYERLVREGVITPAKRPFDPSEIVPVDLPPGAPSLSDVLREMRDEERY